jgi:hypothetical protein
MDSLGDCSSPYPDPRQGASPVLDSIPYLDVCDSCCPMDHHSGKPRPNPVTLYVSDYLESPVDTYLPRRFACVAGQGQ